MTDEWFHKRGPDEGIGYSIKNARGLAACVVFIVVMSFAVIAAVNAPAVLHTPPLPTLFVAMGIHLILIFAFVCFVRARSDSR